MVLFLIWCSNGAHFSLLTLKYRLEKKGERKLKYLNIKKELTLALFELI